MGLHNTPDMLIVDECSISAGPSETVHKLCCFARKDTRKSKRLFGLRRVKDWDPDKHKHACMRSVMECRAAGA